MRRAVGWVTLLGVLLGTPAWADRPTDWYTPVTKSDNTTDAQTDKALWTPASGARSVVDGCTVSADATQTIELEVSNADVFPAIYLAANSSVSIGYGSSPLYQSATNGVLAYTTTTSANTTIVCSGYEAQQ